MFTGFTGMIYEKCSAQCGEEEITQSSFFRSPPPHLSRDDRRVKSVSYISSCLPVHAQLQDCISSSCLHCEEGKWRYRARTVNCLCCNVFTLSNCLYGVRVCVHACIFFVFCHNFYGFLYRCSPILFFRRQLFSLSLYVSGCVRLSTQNIAANNTIIATIFFNPLVAKCLLRLLENKEHSIVSKKAFFVTTSAVIIPVDPFP